MRLLRPTRLLATLVAAVTMALACSLLVSTSSASAATSGAHRSARAGAVSAVASSYDAEILYWTNVARRAHGIRPLVGGRCVDGFAERWTLRMARYNTFSHQSLRPVLRQCRRTMAGENIATWTGGISARSIVGMWMRSPGHRHNILNRKFRYLGVAAWRSSTSGKLYATQDFSR